MTDHNFKSRFPLWQYLCQPVFDSRTPLELNPTRFWQRYRIRHLERCWSRTYRPEERFRS